MSVLILAVYKLNYNWAYVKTLFVSYSDRILDGVLWQVIVDVGGMEIGVRWFPVVAGVYNR